MSSTTDPVELRCTTVGRVMPHTSVRIVDTAHALYPAEETPSVAIGVPGELWSAGYQVQHGYWNNEAETDKVVFRDATGLRWMRTGDEAIMNAEGYVSIVGRIKDVSAFSPFSSSKDEGQSPDLIRRLSNEPADHHPRGREHLSGRRREPRAPPPGHRRLLVRSPLVPDSLPGRSLARL